MLRASTRLIAAVIPMFVSHFGCASEPAAAETTDDNAAPIACANCTLQWSYRGAIKGMHCVAFTEAADPHTWRDNYLCSKADLGLRWSSSGPIGGLTCTKIVEPGDPDAWNDNYLCATKDYQFKWSFSGPIRGMQCTKVEEPSDPHGWNDNYLCLPNSGSDDGAGGTSGSGTDSGQGVVYENNVDGMPLGLAAEDEVEEHWRSRYVAGADERRIEVVQGSDAHTGKGLRIKYPKNANQTDGSGATWETALGVHTDELYMSYWVKFDQDFDWVKGGKLPGFGGMPAPFPDNARNKFRIRLMWREEGKIEFYLHDFALPTSEGDEPYREPWDYSGTHVAFIKGRWHHIELHVKLNTPGNLDGLLEGWLDGNLAYHSSGASGVRGAGEQDRKLNYIFFSTFFGGSSAPETQWQPKRDVYASFDDFVVSTGRIGSAR